MTKHLNTNKTKKNMKKSSFPHKTKTNK